MAPISCAAKTWPRVDMQRESRRNVVDDLEGGIQLHDCATAMIEASPSVLAEVGEVDCKGMRPAVLYSARFESLISLCFLRGFLVVSIRV